MNTIKNLCVYCGGSYDVKDVYKKDATQTGLLCARQGWRVIYGGGRVGLMGLVADAALQAGGKVTGVIPQNLKDREIAHNNLTELHITQTMHERQHLMAELSDAFVVLPGGLGTLAEFFEIVTWRQLGLHKKPIVIVNTNEYWDFLIQTLDRVVQENFLHSRDSELFTVIANIDELPKILGGKIN